MDKKKPDGNIGLLSLYINKIDLLPEIIVA